MEICLLNPLKSCPQFNKTGKIINSRLFDNFTKKWQQLFAININKQYFVLEQKQFSTINFISMSNKRAKIFLLKQKLVQMQNELQILQKSEQAKNTSKSQKKMRNTSPRRNSSKNPQYKNPNFWGINPINHEDTYSPKRHRDSTSPTSRSLERQRIERQYSPILKNVINTVDCNYYNSIRQYEPKETHELKHFYETAYPGKRFEHAVFGMPRPSPTKEDRKRVFDKKKTDPVLSPEAPKQSYRKIVKPIERSPERMLIENERSNSDMFYCANKAVFLERKGAMRNKNNSTITLTHCASQLLAGRPSQEGVPGKRRKSQKKHFSKYFEETLFSRI